MLNVVVRIEKRSECAQLKTAHYGRIEWANDRIHEKAKTNRKTVSKLTSFDHRKEIKQMYARVELDGFLAYAKDGINIIDCGTTMIECMNDLSKYEVGTHIKLSGEMQTIKRKTGIRTCVSVKQMEVIE